MKQEQENYSENEAYWNKRSEIFDTQILTTYEEAYRKTIDYTKKYLKDSDKALDIGCGTGGRQRSGDDGGGYRAGDAPPGEGKSKEGRSR